MYKHAIKLVLISSLLYKKKFKNKIKEFIYIYIYIN